MLAIKKDGTDFYNRLKVPVYHDFTKNICSYVQNDVCTTDHVIGMRWIIKNPPSN